MYFNRFDIVTAWYVYCCLYHSGQNSSEYKRLSKINNYFNSGGMGVSLTDGGHENAREIFLDIVGRKGYNVTSARKFLENSRF